MADTGQKPGYWAVLPAAVRYDAKIPASAKLLYAEISSLTDARGYCYATNAYFETLYGLSKRTIIRLLQSLEDAGYLQVVDNDGGNAQRKIYAGINPLAVPGDKNVTTPLTKMSPPGDKNVTPIKNNKDTSIIPPISPQGDAQSAELFARFWAVYPKKRNKADAEKAWRALKPSLTLCRRMSKALAEQKRSEQWTKEGGRFIPYPATWIRGRQWENEAERPLDAASDEEVRYGWQTS